jgi:hypothetical protein
MARMADRFVGAHPDDPLSNEIRDSPPAFLRSRGAEALDRAQPLNDVLYFRAYASSRSPRPTPSSSPASSACANRKTTGSGLDFSDASRDLVSRKASWPRIRKFQS